MNDQTQTTSAQQAKSHPSASQRKTDMLVSTLDAMAGDLEKAAKELRRISKDIEVDRDVMRTSEAAEVLTNLMGNLRLDKLVLMPCQILKIEMLEQRNPA
ncbi:hypothetical protein IFT48_04110 [Pseudomonas fluorescens]|uniref:hypothetical protein n=1 Tax=Pseudomonas fluorescens TaxID=294 RepID=UPI001930A84B|nr:hypothetical protein [Pseudomonas fluorescens]MBD8089156.1 hypothetical protein [Pseudomonas fluorescens]